MERAKRRKNHQRIAYLVNRNAKSGSVIERKRQKYLLNIVYSGLFRWSLLRISMCVCADVFILQVNESSAGSNAVCKIQTLFNRIYLANWDILLNKLIATTATKTTLTRPVFLLNGHNAKYAQVRCSSKINQNKQITTTSSWTAVVAETNLRCAFS